MSFPAWLKNLTSGSPPKSPRANSNRATASFKPQLESLGERVVPYASPFGYEIENLLAVQAAFRGSEYVVDDTAVASQLRVTTRAEVYVGAEVRVKVRALDEDGRPVRNYTGTIALTSSDPNAVLPENYTFTTDDHGRHTFTVQLATEGEQTITATDTTTDTILGTATVDVNAAPVATHFFVRTERDVSRGTVTRVVVAALDASNRVVPTYTGTVSLTSSDADATLPEAYTFTASDRGVKVFEVTPSATGDVTITATDTADATITGSVTVNIAAAQVATRFVLITRPTAAADEATRVYVVALDDDNRIVKNYTGTVTLTSSDAAATLPEAYTFTAEDRGVKSLSVTLATSGSQTITATDDTNTLTGSATVSVGTSSLPRLGFGDHFGSFRRRR